MKHVLFFSLILLAACTSKVTTETETDTDAQDTISIDHTGTDQDTTIIDPEGISPKVYSNARFRDVTVEKTAENTYRLTGQGQIFEANFNWVIEDGHDELKSGYTMTDAGAPAWGNFNFTVTASKKNSNSTLHLVLFEVSAKDGSRQHQLPIPLY